MSMYIDDNPLEDYVVAKGKSGYWDYIKFANGYAMCWLSWDGTSGPYNSNGPVGMPHAHYINFSYPFTFYTIPTITAMCRVGSGFSFTCFGPAATVTTQGFRVYFSANTNETSCSVRAMANGLWKALT